MNDYTRYVCPQCHAANNQPRYLPTPVCQVCSYQTPMVPEGVWSDTGPSICVAPKTQAMKYIVVNDGSGDLMFTFPSEIKHYEVFKAASEMRPGVDCIAAGFIMSGHCYGRSESLGVESRNVTDTLLLSNGGAS